MGYVGERIEAGRRLLEAAEANRREPEPTEAEILELECEIEELGGLEREWPEDE